MLQFRYVWFFLCILFNTTLVKGQGAVLVLFSEAELMEKSGLVNIHTYHPDIAVLLIYATSDNFTRYILYKNLKEAYLQPETAEKLANAQKILQEKHPSYKLIVYDAARPQWVQALMWKKVKGTPGSRYVSRRISMHAYGVAVDVSILDENNIPLDMGSSVDHFGELAEPRLEDELLKKGMLSLRQIENRKLLRSTMRKAGFRSISNEWWHFEATSRNEAERKYKPV